MTIEEFSVNFKLIAILSVAFNQKFKNAKHGRSKKQIKNFAKKKRKLTIVMIKQVKDLNLNNEMICVDSDDKGTSGASKNINIYS